MKKKQILYLDMDGVIADFDTAIKAICPELETSENYPDYESRSNKVDEIVGNKRDLFHNLPPIKGAVSAVNKLFKLSGKPLGAPLSLSYIESRFQFLKQMTYEERIKNLDLIPDRADVIIPATKIYLNAMKWSGAKKVYVPKIGLADGLINHLYEQVK